MFSVFVSFFSLLRLTLYRLCTHGSSYPELVSGSQLHVASEPLGQVHLVSDMKQMMYTLLISSVPVVAGTEYVIVSHSSHLSAMQSGNAGICTIMIQLRHGRVDL